MIKTLLALVLTIGSAKAFLPLTVQNSNGNTVQNFTRKITLDGNGLSLSAVNGNVSISSLAGASYTGVSFNGDFAQIFPSNGFLARTASGSYSVRKLSYDNGVVITNNGGLAGSPFITFNQSLYQSSNGNLTTLAGKAAPSGSLVGTTDTQTLTNKTINGSTLLSTITSNGKFAFQKTAYFDEVRSQNSTAATTVNWTVGNKQKIVLRNSPTIKFTDPTGPMNGIIEIVQDNGGSHTITWNADILFPSASGDFAPNTTNGSINAVSCFYDGVRYLCQGGAAFE